jgi:hypothetical protein
LTARTEFPQNDHETENHLPTFDMEEDDSDHENPDTLQTKSTNFRMNPIISSEIKIDHLNHQEKSIVVDLLESEEFDSYHSQVK